MQSIGNLLVDHKNRSCDDGKRGRNIQSVPQNHRPNDITRGQPNICAVACLAAFQTADYTLNMSHLTQDEKDAIRDAGVAQWWKDWFEADYSWDGLADRPWQGWVVVEDKTAYKQYIKAHGLPKGCPNTDCQVVPADYEGLPEGTITHPANLQDYWRDQEGKLEGLQDKTQYTIAHLPTYFQERVRSWKADTEHENWQKLSTIVTDRLDKAARTNVQLHYGGEQVKSLDRRANFSGCILPALPYQTSNKLLADPSISFDIYGDENRALHLSLYRAAILQPQNFTNTIFGSTTDFRHAQFSGGDTNFEDANFSGGGADFEYAQFSRGTVNFGYVEFSGGKVSFWETLFSGGDANFLGAEFSVSDTTFNGAQFSGGDADFRHAKFSGGAAYFFETRFSGGNTHFSGAEFSGGEVYFVKSQFSGGYASFDDVQFSSGQTNFSETQFSGGDAYFRGAHFSGGQTDFSEAQFSGGDADFGHTQFSGGDAIFSNVMFKESFNFENSRFDKRTLFENVTFPPAAGSQSAFRGTQFLGPADFSRTKFTNKDEKDLSIEMLHFPFNAFDNANFKDQLILTQRGGGEAQIEFNRALASVSEACKSEKNKDKIEAYYVALEAGCTTLKRVMENTSDKNRAQRYFKFELMARRDRPSTQLITKIFTTFYGWVADYGGSITRPLITLGVVWAAFAAIYALNALCVEVNPTDQSNMIWDPVGFSTTHIFRPFYIWSKVVAADNQTWLGQYKSQLSDGGWIFIKLLATLQSFLSITLLFLFGLATKRKFQIS